MSAVRLWGRETNDNVRLRQSVRREERDNDFGFCPFYYYKEEEAKGNRRRCLRVIELGHRKWGTIAMPLTNVPKAAKGASRIQI